MTHRRFLPQIIETPSAAYQIFARFIKMVIKMESSVNGKVSFLARMSRSDQRSIIGSNIHVIARRLNVEDKTVVTNDLHGLKVISQEDCDIISVILDVINFRNDDFTINGFTGAEMDFM